MDLAPGFDENGNETLWNSVNVANNPYFVTNKYRTADIKNRFIGQASLRFDLTDNLFIKAGVSRDFYNFEYEGIVPTGTAFRPKGIYESFKTDVSETNFLGSVHFDDRFFDDLLSVSAMFGGNRQRNNNNTTTINGQEYIIPEFYSYTNLAVLSTTPSNLKTGINSVFGSFDLGYKSMLYLTFTGRQDWFSTLSPENNSIFYPSVGGSFILSEVLKMPDVISFVKLRSSWAQVGGGAPDPYLINQTYGLVQGGHNGRTAQEITSDIVTNPNLRPLTSTTFEIGADIKFLNKRAGIDITYYNSKTSDDIVQADVSNASGYRRALLNVGELSNKGIELLLSGTPLKSSNGLTWDVSYNFAYNKSEIISLTEDSSSILVGKGIGPAFIQHVEGKPYGSIYGYYMARNDNGQKIFNSNSGYEVRSELSDMGQGVAPISMGLSNSFRYKNLSLDILLDGKFGNKIFSNLAYYSHRFGLTKETLPGRENGLLLQGVDTNGNPYERLVPVEEIDTYYDNQKKYTEFFMYNGDFVKLREVVLTYRLPVGKLAFLGEKQSTSIALVGRNLAILHKKTDLFDPESSYTSGNAQGLEAFGVPRTRNIGVNLKIKF